MADPGGELAELPRGALGVRAEALHERQQRLDAPAQALGGGAAEEGAPHRAQQLPQHLPGELLQRQPVHCRRCVSASGSAAARG